MKKVLLTAALTTIAATMSIPAFADISIKGDAHFRYSNRDVGNVKSNPTNQAVRLHITGKSGNTTVKLGLRNDGGTRVSAGNRGTGGSTVNTAQAGSSRGIDAGCTATTAVSGAATATTTCSNAKQAIFAVDYSFLTTKIGRFNIKIGDWWATTGVGLVRKGVPIQEGIVLGTKIGGVNVGIKGVAGGNELFYTVKAKLSGFKTVLQISNSDTDGYVDVMVKGKFAGLGIAAEIWAGDVFSANVVHVWKNIGGITWHVAYAGWGKFDTPTTKTRFASNSKFSPLGVSILGSAPGVNGGTAIGNVNKGTRIEDTDVFGVRADLKLAGMGLQVAVGNLNLGTAADDSFKDIILTRPLGKGSNIKVSYGTWNDNTTLGAKVSVKF